MREFPDKPVVQALVQSTPSAEWSRHSLELLGDASQFAKKLGGKTVAWTLPPFPAREKLEALGAFGCDGVMCLDHPRLSRWSSEAVAFAIADSLSPSCRAVLLPGDARGEEVAALLAGARGLQWIGDAISISATRTGAVEVTAAQGEGGKLSRVFRAPGERPVVVTIREGVAEARRETAPRSVAIEQISVQLDTVPELTRVCRRIFADPKTQDIVFARRIVAGGRGTGGPDGMRLVESLSEAIGASLAASRVAVDLGWAPPERQVGQTGRTVRPDLYVACGISGASHHLAGMRESRHIVAINPDASAPIHELAKLSLKGELNEVIPAVKAALKRRRERA